MPIHLIREQVSSKQLTEMLEELGSYVKPAVDIRLSVLAGGGELHADCETKLLENESSQEDIWGADWYPHSQQTGFESLINIRPRQGNFSMEVEDEERRTKIREISENLLGGVTVD